MEETKPIIEKVYGIDIINNPDLKDIVDNTVHGYMSEAPEEIVGDMGQSNLLIAKTVPKVEVLENTETGEVIANGIQILKPNEIVATPKPVGRPSDYTQEIADTICEQISQGKSLRSICREENMPSGVTIFSWLRTNPEFLSQYDRATSERTETQQEMILEIGDEAIVHAETSDPKASGAIVSAYKLKADNLKWSMSKMKPKKYGDKVDVTSDGKAIKGNAIIFNDFKDEANSQ